MANYEKELKRYVEAETSALKSLDFCAVSEAMNAIDTARLCGGTVFVMGNGGSASTASHFANDFNKGLSEHISPPFNFVCLADNIATVLAVANDIGYDSIFEFQLRGKVARDDVVVGISASGNSVNVLKATSYAKTVGATTIGLTGFDGGALAGMVDLSLNVQISDMQITEDIHLAFDHMMMSVFLNALKELKHEEAPS